MSSPSKRRDMDLMKLITSDYQVSMGDAGDFYVKFYGPKESSYDGGIWKVHVTLQPDYPYKSPSIGFVNRIYHPNVDEASGSVCLDVINQTWSPMFDLVNVFSVFLPQLLLYPNPTDPLNGHAAALLLKDKKEYEKRVKDYVKKYASDDFNVDDDEESTNPDKSASQENGQNNMDDDEQLSDIDDMPGDSGISTDPAADLEL